MLTREEIEKSVIILTIGCCMKNPGPCDICGGQTSLMYGLFAPGYDHALPLAVICINSHPGKPGYLQSLCDFWNNLPVEVRINRAMDRLQSGE